VNLVAAAAAALLGVVPAMQVAAQAQAAPARPEALVKQRQAAMQLKGTYMGLLRAGLRDATPYDADRIARNARFLEALAPMPWDDFADETQGAKSRARAEIFRDPAGFRAAARAFEAEVAGLAAAARARDPARVRVAFAAVSKACGACHDGFRAR
jgi:cytochrome c556